MKQAIQTFKKHKSSIETYILENIRNNRVEEFSDGTMEKFFQIFKSLEATFVVDSKHIQITPRYTKNSRDALELWSDQTSLFNKVVINEDGYYLSNPYVCAHTGKPTITIVRELNNHYIIMDFNLMSLLEDLDYVSKSVLFTNMTKYTYGAIGYGLAFFALILIAYSVFAFGNFLIIGTGEFLDTIFKSIIALTLGLAIFDLAVNLLEDAVVYKNNTSDEHGENKVLTKFLISIIIALSIESLMVVFKIALKDYSHMQYALYLIIGVSLMIISLAVFYKFSTSIQNK